MLRQIPVVEVHYVSIRNAHVPTEQIPIQPSVNVSSWWSFLHEYFAAQQERNKTVSTDPDTKMCKWLL